MEAGRGDPLPGADRYPYLAATAIERITVDPERMGGVGRVRDHRVSVSVVLGQLAAGRTTDRVADDYPYFDLEDVLAALEYAAAVNGPEVPVAKPA